MKACRVLLMAALLILSGVPALSQEHAGHGGPPAAKPETETQAKPPAAPPPEIVHISPQRQQQIGVRYASVEHRRLVKALRAVARVEYNEKTLATITTKIGGWIERLYVNTTGELVSKGQRLLDIYSPELLATQEEYLVALRAKRELARSPNASVAEGGEALLQAARRRLELWDISQAQIERLERTGKPTKTLSLYSPLDGHVIRKEPTEGMEIRPGMPLYQIANLSTVWIEGDFYEFEAPFIEIGQMAKVRLPYLPDEVLAGRVDYIYPYLNEETRTVRVRMVFPNPQLRLKPGMYANVNLDVDLGHRLAVPAEALLDTGTQTVAFVDRGQGNLETREVAVGAKVGDYYVVEDGLHAGERVVASANFLIASESKLREALGGAAHAGH